MIKILLLLLSLFAGAIQAETLELPKDRTVIIRGVIGGGALSYARQIVKLADGSDHPIYIVINSPGGGVAVGSQILSAITIAKERGHKIICAVPMLAASMGFQVLVHCNERYALRHALLLFHPMANMTDKPINQEDALYIAGRLRAWEKPFIKDLLKALKISTETFLYHYRRETMWFAAEFTELSPKFLTIVEDITGVDGLFDVQ